MKNKKNAVKKNGNDNTGGFIMWNRSEKSREVIKLDHATWHLLCLIALRTWRGPGKSVKNCLAGEAFLGDFEEHCFTEKEYRCAKKKLVTLNLATFRADTHGTRARLVDASVFDVNVAQDVMERVAVGRTEGGQGADQGRTRGGQGATNKNIRMEEGRIGTKKEDNNNNKPGGVVVAPSEPGAGAVAPEAGPMPEAEVQPEAAEDEVQPGIPQVSEDVLTPVQKATFLSRRLPQFLKDTYRLNRLPVFTQSSLEEVITWFSNPEHSTWEYWDVMVIVMLAIQGVRNNPPPQEGFDPWFWSRKYAKLPNRLFGKNVDNELIFEHVKNETKYNPSQWDQQIAEAAVQKEFDLCQGTGN